MAQSDTTRREIARMQTKGAELRKTLAAHRTTAVRATEAAQKKRGEAARTKSTSTQRTALAAAAREDKKHADATAKVADAEKKIADNAKAVAAQEQRLTSALSSERRAADRDDDRRRQKERSHARELARLSTPREVRYVEVRPPAPERLRVLYVTANPHAVEVTLAHHDGTLETDGVWLRVDQEVRQVKSMVKSSRYRDLVTVEHLPAATRADVQDGLNDHRPHVVHFSGHAGSWGVLLEDEQGSTEGRGMDYALLARLLGATDTPPRLVVLNACQSLDGVEPLLQTVPAAVAMADAVDDASAVVFAGRFYAAIASAQSVASALDQAKLAMTAASLDGAELPVALAREGVDLGAMVLVQPPNV